MRRSLFSCGTAQLTERSARAQNVVALRQCRGPILRGCLMKKIVTGLVVLLALAGAAMFMYRDQINMLLAFGRLKPEHNFSDVTPRLSWKRASRMLSA